jgi:hypothetical protein
MELALARVLVTSRIGAPDKKSSMDFDLPALLEEDSSLR